MPTWVPMHNARFGAANPTGAFRTAGSVTGAGVRSNATLGAPGSELGAAGRAREDVLDHIDRNGLRQMAVEARLLCHAAGPRAARSRSAPEEDAPQQPLVGTDGACHLVAVHSGQADVAQDDVGSELSRLQSIPARPSVRHLNLVPLIPSASRRLSAASMLSSMMSTRRADGVSAGHGRAPRRRERGRERQANDELRSLAKAFAVRATGRRAARRAPSPARARTQTPARRASVIVGLRERLETDASTSGAMPTPSSLTRHGLPRPHRDDDDARPPAA